MNFNVFEEVQTAWELISGDGNLDLDEFNSRINKDFLDTFQVGKFYYFLLDLQRLHFLYLHPDIEVVLGYKADEIDLNFLLSKIHPDDQIVFLNHENTVVSFFSKLPADKFLKYKVAYDYRIMNTEGNYVRILHQVVVVQHDQTSIITTMGIHTDITHIKSSNKSTLSFIGLQDEPSFYNVEVKEIYIPSTLQISKREKEVMLLMMKGMTSKQIAAVLAISSHTVATHRKNIFKKTNSKTFFELQNKVITDGLL
jgi:DNA-binding CsgD family transcriptional regulator